MILAGKKALVTGGTSEIGHATAAALARGSQLRRVDRLVGLNGNLYVNPCPTPRGAFDLDRSSERLGAVPETHESRASVEIGSANAVISYREKEHVLLHTSGDRHNRGIRVLRRVGQRLRNDVVPDHLDLLGEALLKAKEELDGNGRAAP